MEKLHLLHLLVVKVLRIVVQLQVGLHILQCRHAGWRRDGRGVVGAEDIGKFWKRSGSGRSCCSCGSRATPSWPRHFFSGRLLRGYGWSRCRRGRRLRRPILGWGTVRRFYGGTRGVSSLQFVLMRLMPNAIKNDILDLGERLWGNGSNLGSKIQRAAIDA